MVGEVAGVWTGRVGTLILNAVNRHCTSTSGNLDIPKEPPVVLPDLLVDGVPDSVRGEVLEGRHFPGNGEVDHHTGGIVNFSKGNFW